MIATACSKDESSSDNIVGTWTAGDATFTAMVGTRTLSQYFTEVMGLSATEAGLYTSLFTQGIQQSFAGTIQIKADGTYIASMGGDSDTGTWSLSDDGKKITIDSSTELPVTYDVVELTANLLHLNISESETEDLNDDGTPETIIMTIDVSFTK
jgi:hypothetical protein